jgi:hypothetical protein
MLQYIIEVVSRLRNGSALERILGRSKEKLYYTSYLTSLSLVFLIDVFSELPFYLSISIVMSIIIFNNLTFIIFASN